MKNNTMAKVLSAALAVSSASALAEENRKMNTKKVNEISHTKNVKEKRSGKNHLVMKVQKTLDSKGYKTATDGLMSPETEKQIKKFQEDNSLDPTGEINVATLKELGVNERYVNEAKKSAEENSERL